MGNPTVIVPDFTGELAPLSDIARKYAAFGTATDGSASRTACRTRSRSCSSTWATILACGDLPVLARAGGEWFQAAQPGARSRGGWDFLVSFHGALGDVRPDELVSTFESSLPECRGRDRDVNVGARLLALWVRVQPSVDRSAFRQQSNEPRP